MPAILNTKRVAAALVFALGWLPGPAQAQTPRREVSLDFRPLSGVISMAWRAGSVTFFGLSAGGGIDMLDLTISPDPAQEEFHRLEQLGYLGVFLRYKPSSRIDVDLGGRTGFGSVRSCTASDCWPGLLSGAYAGVFLGGKRWKAGPRVLIARVTDNEQSDNVVYLEILTGRLAFSW